MGRGLAWKSSHLKDLAEAMLLATEDCIIGTDQKADRYKCTLWDHFVAKDPVKYGVQYRKRSVDAVFKKTKEIYAAVMRFQKSVTFIKALNPTGNLTPDELLSLMIAHHFGLMGRPQDKAINYDLKDTPHSEWDYADAYKVLRTHPKWQCADGPVENLAGRTNLISGTSGSATPESAALDISPSEGITETRAAPISRKKSEACA
jgi:hypothetical protein